MSQVLNEFFERKFQQITGQSGKQCNTFYEYTNQKCTHSNYNHDNEQNIMAYSPKHQPFFEFHNWASRRGSVMKQKGLIIYHSCNTFLSTEREDAD